MESLWPRAKHAKQYSIPPPVFLSKQPLQILVALSVKHDEQNPAAAISFSSSGGHHPHGLKGIGGEFQ
jgi:hypothetical protein|tara:strand:+ start:248 stop:451 length:204 start_codon:yes stop_codon:yes gene_type:complete